MPTTKASKQQAGTTQPCQKLGRVVTEHYQVSAPTSLNCLFLFVHPFVFPSGYWIWILTQLGEGKTNIFGINKFVFVHP